MFKLEIIIKWEKKYRYFIIKEKGLYDQYMNEVKYEQSIKSEIAQELLEVKNRKLKRQLREMK